ncbi:MAG: hypothetical protein ACK4YQ_02780 [Phenylobacterium sp.]|uniref:hypothetical protein n=1 Tax=Phenylobacterium sp. TaxID=1871053 RepID=UPI00391BF50A
MNPEFQRNLWLEASPRRLAWAAVTLVLVYGAALLTVRGRPELAAHTLSGVGFLVYVVCGLLWASRAAGGSVLAEIAERTWDFQRLSALTPWQMTWGKLFGAGSLAWLCALSGLLAMVPLTLQAGAPRGWWSLGFFLALALLFQALALGAALIGVRKARAEGRPARGGVVLGGLLLGLVLLSAVSGSSGFQKGVGLDWLRWLFEGDGFVAWWGLIAPAAGFRTLAAGFFALFAVVGAWRLMRLELMMGSALLVWPVFLAFLAVFAGGFPFRNEGLGASLVAAALAVALCAYAAAFAEPADRVRLRRFAAALRGGDVRGASPLAPAALAPWVVAVALVILALGVGGWRDVRAWQGAALMAFVARDLGVIAWFRMGPRPQRGDLAAILALALAYGVGGVVGSTLAGRQGAAVFAPLAGYPISLISGVVQALVMGLLVARRFSAPPVAPASAPGS